MSDYCKKMGSIGEITIFPSNNAARINVPGDGNCGIYAAFLCLHIQKTNGAIFPVRLPRTMEECRLAVYQTACVMLEEHQERTQSLPVEMTMENFTRELNAFRDMNDSNVIGTIELAFIHAVIRRMLGNVFDLTFFGHDECDLRIVHCPGHFQVDVSQEIFDFLSQNNPDDDFDSFGNDMYQYFFARKVNNTITNTKRKMGAVEELCILRKAINALSKITGLGNIDTVKSQLVVVTTMSFLQDNMQEHAAENMLMYFYSKSFSQFMKSLNCELRKMKDCVVLCEQIIDSIKTSEDKNAVATAIATTTTATTTTTASIEDTLLDVNIKKALTESNIVRQRVLEDERRLIEKNIDDAQKKNKFKQFDDTSKLILETGTHRCDEIRGELADLKKDMMRMLV